MQRLLPVDLALRPTISDYDSTLGTAPELGMKRDRPRSGTHRWKGRCRTDTARCKTEDLLGPATMQIVTESPSRVLIWPGRSSAGETLEDITDFIAQTT